MLSKLVAGLAPAVWGTTYYVTTEFLPPDRPLTAAMLRALPAGCALAVLGRQLPRGQWWWRSTVLGVLNIGAFFALLFIAAYRLPGGVAATVGAVQPLLVIGIAWTVTGEHPTRTRVGAALVGMCGVALLVLGPGAHLDVIGVAAAIGAAGCMGLGIVLTKKWGRPASLIVTTGWQLLAGGVALVPVVVVVEGLPSNLTAANIGGYTYLTVVGTALAYTVWFWGVLRLPSVTLSLLGLLSPLVATLVGWVLLDQRLTIAQLVGGLVVVASLAVAATDRVDSVRPASPGLELSEAGPDPNRSNAPNRSSP